MSCPPGGGWFKIVRDTASSSAICVGDSGGSAYNTTLIGSNLLMGIACGSNGAGCAAVGGWSQYTIPDGTWIKNVVTFFGGSCTTTTHAHGVYTRCW